MLVIHTRLSHNETQRQAKHIVHTAAQPLSPGLSGGQLLKGAGGFRLQKKWYNAPIWPVRWCSDYNMATLTDILEYCNYIPLKSQEHPIVSLLNGDVRLRPLIDHR